jgi:multiple antibiotic resistance protein
MVIWMKWLVFEVDVWLPWNTGKYIMLKNILLSFIPIFVAVDAIGVLPIFVSLTDGLEQKERIKVILQSMITAIILAMGFILIGRLVFRLLGIEMGDFMIAGGAILFCLAIIDIVNPTKKRRIPGDELGAVPLGTPLIAGPAVLTTSILIISEYGLAATTISIIANILLAGFIFKSSFIIMKVLGVAGTKAMSKIVSLLLAALAVMLIRKGLGQFM